MMFCKLTEMLFMHTCVSIYHILVYKRIIQAIHKVVTEGHKNLKCQIGHTAFSRQNMN